VLVGVPGKQQLCMSSETFICTFIYIPIFICTFMYLWVNLHIRYVCMYVCELSVLHVCCVHMRTMKHKQDIHT
jgi:hypothetical protein